MSAEQWEAYCGPLCDDPAERHGQDDAGGWRFAAFGPFQPASDGPDAADLAERGR